MNNQKKIEEIIVEGIKGSAKSQREAKRNAKNITDSIFAEEFGTMPDSNVAEALQRVTGIGIDRRDGEGTFVTVRGVDPNLNQVTLNGQTATTGQDGSDFDFSMLSADMLKAIEVVKPGANLGDIGHAIQTHAEKNYYTVVEEYCGHGIGKIYHDEPQILHYGEANTGQEIIEGMCFTIEPMINLGSKHTNLLEDGWTVETSDGKNSAQWEHTIYVNKDGAEILTQRAEER